MIYKDHYYRLSVGYKLLESLRETKFQEEIGTLSSILLSKVSVLLVIIDTMFKLKKTL